MSQASPVFDQHYDNYLKQLADLDLAEIGRRLGGEVGSGPEGIRVGLHYLGREYQVSASAICRADGSRAGYDASIVLSRYLIMGQQAQKRRTTSPEWVGFRDLKESGPLTVYFRDNVDLALTGILAGKTGADRIIASELDGHTPETDLSYDLVMEIPCLPEIPMLLLFNDADDGFPPSCSVLFRNDVETFLDAECIAMTGYRLAAEIRRILG